MWDVSQIDTREFEYMGYDVELEVFIERDFKDDRMRVVRATASKSGSGNSMGLPATMSSGEHVIDVHDKTNVDGDEKLFGIVEIRPTPMDEQIESVVVETKEKIEESIDERIEARQEADAIFEETFGDDDEITFPDSDEDGDNDGE